MILLIKEISTNSNIETISQAFFYRKVKEKYPNWDEDSVAKCLKFLDEKGDIQVGKDSKITLTLQAINILDQYEKEAEEQPTRQKRGTYADYSRPLEKFMGKKK